MVFFFYNYLDVRIDGDYEITIEKMIKQQFPHYVDNKKNKDLKIRYIFLKKIRFPHQVIINF